MSSEAEDRYRRALALADVSPTGLTGAVLNGWCVLIARVGEQIFALNDRCSHAASQLSAGRLRHGAVMCPVHGARFDLASGKSIGGGHRPVRTFPVRIVDGWIEVAVPDDPPDLSECPVLQG